MSRGKAGGSNAGGNETGGAGHEHPHLVWHERSRKKLYSFGIFDIYLADRSTDDGSRGNFVILDLPHWVTIVPVIREGGEEKFLMVRQFRHGSETVTLEFPAGTVEPGEDPAATAERELLEETGYRADRIALAGRVNPNPAFMNNYTHTFVASGLPLYQPRTWTSSRTWKWYRSRFQMWRGTWERLPT